VLWQKFHVHPVLTSPPSGRLQGWDLPVVVSSADVAPSAATGFAAANSRLAAYPLATKPVMGSTAGTGLYEAELTYSFSAKEQKQLFSDFGGLIEPFGASKDSLPAWEEGLWGQASGAHTRDAILAEWGHRANVVLADGVENDGYVAAVVRLNAA